MEPLNCGDHVAILPSDSALPSDVLEIASIFYAGQVYVQLLDGRMYSSIGGKSLNTRNTTYIVAATDEHFHALQKRKRKNATATVSQ